ESWGFDFADGEGRGGFVRLTWWPARQAAWFWAYVVGPDIGLVCVRDHAVTVRWPVRGRKADFVTRAEGLWSELACNEPSAHWTVRLEAFGLLLDPVSEDVREERGLRTPVGIDADWERAAPVSEVRTASGGGRRSDQPGTVHGELLLGSRSLAFSGV